MKKQVLVEATTDAVSFIEQVSVILPVYNEQTCIETTFDAVLDFARSHPNYHFLFVDDGSTDWTKQLLRIKLDAAHTKQIQLLSYSFNAGKGYAIRRGITHAHGKYICYLDSDLAYSLEHLEALVAELSHADVVIGRRDLAFNRTKNCNLSRKVAGRVFNLLSRRILRLPYLDMQAGLKGFQRSSATQLFSRQLMSGFSFDVELLYLAKKYGFSIREIPAIVGDSHQHKASKINLFSDSLTMLFDLLKIRVSDRRGKYEL